MAERLPWGLKNEGLEPSSMKSMTENKLKAFNIGSMNSRKGKTKKEQDEMRKKMEQEETESVYKDFVESFADSGKNLNKSWVKGGTTASPTANTPGRSEKPPASRLYKPSSKLAELASSFQSAKDARKHAEDRVPPKPVVAIKSKQEKKKSNLELFKEELRAIQEERQERRRIKGDMGIGEEPLPRKSRFEPPEEEPVATGTSIGLSKGGAAEDYRGANYSYSDDVVTTNLYLGNINPKMTEQQLCEVFGRFGPLASIKIMWPRSEEERQRGRNCGFVAFMNRKDGERALANLQGKEVMTFEMKLGWGKAVPIPPHPIYIPPALAELTLPPPPSGLPFNCQPRANAPSVRNIEKIYGNVPPPGLGSSSSQSQDSQDSNEEVDKTVATAVVKVVIPTERNLLHLIHRMIEFVVREGPMFEAMIMNKEISNPMFRFLFENMSPAHVYYRWKLFTILQGESVYKWRTDEFRMFKNGSWWRPPPMNPYTQGMPEELVSKDTGGSKRGALTESQRDRLEDMLRDLIPERSKVGDVMVWCLEHAEAAEEVVECIAESLSILQTPLPKKVARVFLISDILYNCSAKVPNASFYRKYFEPKLTEIFRDMHAAYERIDARLRAEQFKQRIMLCFRAWEDWTVYPTDYLIRLQNVFLGLVINKEDEEGIEVVVKEDIDGAPIEMEAEDIDGAPIDGSAVKEATAIVADDVDGIPIVSADYGDDDDVDGAPLDDEMALLQGRGPGFKVAPSKWESVDESKLESQAVTTSKWDMFEEEKEKGEDDNHQGAPYEEDVDGMPLDDDGVSNSISQDPSPSPSDGRDSSPYPNRQMTEERRAKLREIELKVMKYQDEVESGRRSRKADITMAQQLEQYRKKLLQKEGDREREKDRDRRREEERSRVREWERARDRDRDRDRRDRDEAQVYTSERLVPYGDSRSERRSERGSERQERAYSSDEGDLNNSVKVYERSPEYSSPMLASVARRARSRSPSPPTAYRNDDDTGSARRRHRSRSKSPTTPRPRRRSRTPKKSLRSASPKRQKRSRSRSKSPSRHRHKHKKNRY